MEELNNTLKILDVLRKKCPVDKVRNSDNLIKCLYEELGEIEDALKNNNDENLKEEIGDLLFTTLFLAKVVEDKGFNIDEILEKTNKKMIFRHPHVFENPKDVSIEEANKIWKDQKRKEKELNIIH